jgi:S1-C subfamily serine protease
LAVKSVQAGSPADRAGLKSGDVIREVNGSPAGSLIEFNRALVSAGPKKDVRLGVLRSGKTVPLVLRLVDEGNFFNADLVRRRLGVGVESTESGLVVVSVEGDGPAARRLSPGMFIGAVDGQPVGDLVPFAKLLNNKSVGDPVELGVSVFRRMGPFLRRQDGVVRMNLR